MASKAPSTTDLSSLVHPKERAYQAIVLLVSLVVYAIVALVVLRLLAALGSGLSTMVLYAVLGMAGYALMKGLMLGSIQGNGVRITERQLPQLHRLAAESASRLGLSSLPDLYLLQSAGFLNAFATRFFGRKFVVVYSEIIDIAGEDGDDAVGFVIAHELAHHKRGHLQKHMLLFPGRLIPFLGQAYSRACELTCDRYGAACHPRGAVSGILALAAGSRSHHLVDAGIYGNQVVSEAGFWRSFAEVLSTHPILPRRLIELSAVGLLPAQSERAQHGARTEATPVAMIGR